MTKISDLTIGELINYSKACSLVIDKQIKGSDYYRSVPEAMLSDADLEAYRTISERYKKYKVIEDKIVSEINKRLMDLC